LDLADIMTDNARRPIMDSDALTHPTDLQLATHALAEAASAAGYAPSIHNTQPWRWRLTADTLDLHLVPSRASSSAAPQDSTIERPSGSSAGSCRDRSAYSSSTPGR